MLPVFLFLLLLAALPINTRLGNWGSVFFSFPHLVDCWKRQPRCHPPPPTCFISLVVDFFFLCFCSSSIGIYAPSPAPTMTLSHMLIWHFLLKGHGWIMFCRRRGGCYMKNDAAGVFSRFYVAVGITSLQTSQGDFYLLVLYLFYFAVRSHKYFFSTFQPMIFYMNASIPMLWSSFFCFFFN